MSRTRRVPALLAGAVLATALVGIPAFAASDPNPNTYDHTAPTLTMSPPTFFTGVSMDEAASGDPNDCGPAYHWGIPMLLNWTAADATSGLSTVTLNVMTDQGGEWNPVETETGSGPSSYIVRTGTNYDGSCGDTGGAEHWSLTATDNRGSSATTAYVNTWVDVWQETGQGLYGDIAAPVRTGVWSVSNCACFDWGHDLYSTAKGASLTYTITSTVPGQSVAVAVEAGPARGTMNISVDGGVVQAVSAYQKSSNQHRDIIWAKPLSLGTHTVKIANAGTAGHSRIDVDAILLSDPQGAH